MYTHTHVCMNLSLSLSLSIYIYIYICTHMYICMYVCIYIYIYTYTCIYSLRRGELHEGVGLRLPRLREELEANDLGDTLGYIICYTLVSC